MKRLIMKKSDYSLVFMVLDFNSFQSKLILLKEKEHFTTQIVACDSL